MARDFTLSIGGARGEEWERAVGTRSFYVRSAVPERVMLEDYREPQLAYFLDLDETPPEMLDKIAAYLKWKRGGEIAQILSAVREFGLPIRAEDCSVAIANPQRWF